MSNKQVVIDTLAKKRKQVIKDRAEIIAKLDTEIYELEQAIAEYTGLPMDRTAHDPIYDDQCPDYIKASIED